MNRKVYIIILTISISLSAHCQRLVSGSVYDGENEQGVPFASIFLMHSTTGTSCNETGMYSLHVPQGEENAHVVISALGYRADTVRLSDLIGRKGEVYLQPAAIQLSDVQIVDYTTARKLMDAVLERIPHNYRTDEAVGVWHYRSRRLLNGGPFVRAEGLIRNYMPPYGKMLRVKYTRDASARSDELYRIYQSLDTVLFYDKPRWRSLIGPEELDDKTGIAGLGKPSDLSAIIGTDFVNYMNKKNLRMFSKKSSFLMESFSHGGENFYRITIAFKPRGRTLCDTAIIMINKDDLAIIDAVHIHPSMPSAPKPEFVQKHLYCKDITYASRTHWRYRKYNGKYQLDFVQTESGQCVEFSEKAKLAGCRTSHLEVHDFEECMLSDYTIEGVDVYKQQYLNSKNPRSKDNINETERILREAHSTIPW